MKLKFSIDYFTHPWQKLYIYGSATELGQWNVDKAVEMSYVSSSEWSVEIEIHSELTIEYRFLVKEGDSLLRCEEGSAHQLSIHSGNVFLVRNSWRNLQDQHYLNTSAFTNCFGFHPSNENVIYNEKTILVQVLCPYVDRNNTLIICGSSHALGKWQTNKSLHLQYIGNNIWQIAINAANLEKLQEFKLAVYDTRRNKIIDWEEGENRLLCVEQQKGICVYELDYRRSWYNWRGAGVAIPVFSLRTEDSFGIGEFSDLKKLSDWVSVTGQKVIQVLPVNDTTINFTWTDSYPYNAISTFALHPILFGVKQFPLRDKIKYEDFLRRGAELNGLRDVDYERVLSLKWEYLRELFAECGVETMRNKEFIDFKLKNENWLFSYACFSFLRDRYQTANPVNWKEYRNYDKMQLEDLVNSDQAAKEYCDLMYFVQYLLDSQLVEAKEYANAKGVILKGDIPIGISRGSVEAWVEPHLFNLDVQTGAPPDDFSVTGQNWGFPTYNWSEMAKDGYQWWIERFKKMSDYFDAYRIDHILGFFRIWEIPCSSVQGLLGYFNPAKPLSVEEISQRGFVFDEKRMASPYIHERFLEEIFGEYADEAKDYYVCTSDSQHYKLQDFCNTQAKIQDLLNDCLSGKESRIKDGLFRICNDVLFVRDGYQSDRYHPRITAQQTFSYKQLDEESQRVFSDLYEDYYYHRHSQFWREEALKKLPAILSSTGMLACGEDLGMIPDSVSSVMSDLQILSLEIERMPKTYNVVFANLQRLPYLSVCTTSTHDMSPIRSWWREDRVLIQRYYNEVLHKEGNAPDECPQEICREIICNHLSASSMLTILPIQDWLSMDSSLRRKAYDEERINIPSNPRHYWKYRMHIKLEDLLEAKYYNSEIRLMVEKTGG